LARGLGIDTTKVDEFAAQTTNEKDTDGETQIME
jgi:hypothetical protein